MIIYTGSKREAAKSTKKIKEVFRSEVTEFYDSFDKYGELADKCNNSYYPNISKRGWGNMGLYSSIKTNKQEASFYEQHESEYKIEFGLKLRCKRSPNFISKRWDTKNRCTLQKAKNWKDSTKRKNQYYKEHSA